MNEVPMEDLWAPPPDSDYDSQDALLELLSINAELAELEKRRVELNMLVAEHHKPNEPVLFLDADGEKRTAKVIVSSTPIIDVVGLHDELPSEVFEQISEVKVSAKKLKQAIDTGLVPDPIAHRHVAYKQKRPYVQF